jgi:hypothetical protein
MSMVFGEASLFPRYSGAGWGVGGGACDGAGAAAGSLVVAQLGDHEGLDNPLPPLELSVSISQLVNPVQLGISRW